MLNTASRDDWKLKYRELVGELEDKEREWQALADGLRSVASRLAIAAMGRDELIDRHLKSILDSIKQRAPEDRLAGQLERLSSAVVAQEKDVACSAALDLSGFVARLPLEAVEQRRVSRALTSDSGVARTAALHELADSLNHLVSASGSQGASTGQLQSAALAALLDRLAAIPELRTIADKLAPRLASCSDDASFLGTLDALAASIRAHVVRLDRQKSDLEAFLEQVTRQLSQFESWTDSSQDDARQRRDDAAVLEHSVEQEVDGLHRDVDAADGSGDLKRRVQKRLDAIGHQLKSFRTKEAQRAEQAEQRTCALRQELSRLQSQTADLAARCGDQEQRLMHDTLTGVHTRYAYERRLQEEFQRWQRHGQALSFSIWDIDFFKKVNDRYGHQAGDRLLAAVAGLLSEHTRIEDFVARVGGEEFVILFPSTPIETAATLSERLREQVEGASFRHHGEPIDVTVSCGITQFTRGDTAEGVYERADRALYKAKNSGRNRCVQA